MKSHSNCTRGAKNEMPKIRAIAKCEIIYFVEFPVTTGEEAAELLTAENFPENCDYENFKILETVNTGNTEIILSDSEELGLTEFLDFISQRKAEAFAPD